MADQQGVAMSTFEEQERRLIMLGLSIASTYCDLAETCSRQWRDSSKERVLQKARWELTITRQRFSDYGAVFGSEHRAIRARLAELQERVTQLEERAA
jgi:hypothetical protein